MMRKQKSSAETARLPSLGRPPAPSKRLPQTSENSRSKETTSAPNLDVIKIRTSVEGDELICEGVNNAIHEYLLRKNLTQTLQAFQTELLNRPSGQFRSHLGQKSTDFVNILQTVDSPKLKLGFRGRQTRGLL